MSQALGGWTAGPRGVPSPRNPSSTLTCGRSRRTWTPHLGSALAMVVSGRSLLPEAARPQMLCPTRDLSNLRGGILGGGSEDMRGAHNSPGLPTYPASPEHSDISPSPSPQRHPDSHGTPRLPQDTPSPQGHPLSPETHHLPWDTPSSLRHPLSHGTPHLPRDTPSPPRHPDSPETPHLPRDTPSSPVCLDQKGEESGRNARTLPTRVPQA